MYCLKLDTCVVHVSNFKQYIELMCKLGYMHKEWQQCQFEINVALFIRQYV